MPAADDHRLASPPSNTPFIPGWPRALHREWAAAYVGLSPSKWSEEVEAGRAPKPVQLTAGRVAWLREVLDAWVDDRAAQGQDRKRPNDFDEGADP